MDSAKKFVFDLRVMLPSWAWFCLWENVDVTDILITHINRIRTFSLASVQHYGSMTDWFNFRY